MQLSIAAEERRILTKRLTWLINYLRLSNCLRLDTAGQSGPLDVSVVKDVQVIIGTLRSSSSLTLK